MFVPFYQEKTNFEIAAEMFADAAWVAGYIVGFAIALYQHFAAPTAEATLEVPTVTPSPNRDTLRSQCQAAGIKWNRAGHGGKHLTKAEMIQKLSEAKAC